MSDQPLLNHWLNVLSEEYLTIAQIKLLFATGGIVLQVLGGVGFVLFSLLIHRIWFRVVEYPKIFNQCLQATDAKQLTLLKGSAHIALMRSMNLIRTTISICPLLGLVGTVVGMIEIFDVIAINGVSSAQLMASGVGRAILPTMAGMVLAISAMFVFAYIQRWVIKQRRVLSGINMPDASEPADKLSNKPTT